MGCWRILAVSGSQAGPASIRNCISGGACCNCFCSVIKIVQPKLRICFAVKSTWCLWWRYKPAKLSHRFHLWCRLWQLLSTLRTSLFTYHNSCLLCCSEAWYIYWHFMLWRTSSHYAPDLQCGSSTACVLTKLWLSATPTACTLLLPPSVSSSYESHLEPICIFSCTCKATSDTSGWCS